MGLDYSFPASMEAPSNAPPFGAGVTPGSLENLGAHYYIGNTKIATMFASHGASGKAPMGCAGRLDELERWLLFGRKWRRQPAKSWREPDVHLIKQAEQVTKSALEGPTWRFAWIPSPGVTELGRNPCISDLAITALAVIWLQKQPYHQKRADGDLWQCCRPKQAVLRTGPHRLPNRCSAKFGETAIISKTWLAAQISK